MKEYVWLFPIIFMFHDMEEIIGFKFFLRQNEAELKQRFPLILRRYKNFSTEGFALAVYEELILCIAISVLAQAPEGNDIVDESNATVIEKLEALKAQLAKRSTSKAPTKTQKANEEVKTLILNVLTDTGEKMTITEMLTDDRLKGFTNQKISALLRQMIESGKATKTIENKKAYFKATVE